MATLARDIRVRVESVKIFACQVLESIVGETAVAAIVDAILVTVHQLLLRQYNLIPGQHFVHTLNRSNHSKRPTRTALTLVLDRCHVPINILGSNAKTARNLEHRQLRSGDRARLQSQVDSSEFVV